MMPIFFFMVKYFLKDLAEWPKPAQPIALSECQSGVTRC
jgi:hypothetical protein